MNKPTNLPSKCVLWTEVKGVGPFSCFTGASFSLPNLGRFWWPHCILAGRPAVWQTRESQRTILLHRDHSVCSRSFSLVKILLQKLLTLTVLHRLLSSSLRLERWAGPCFSSLCKYFLQVVWSKTGVEDLWALSSAGPYLLCHRNHSGVDSLLCFWVWGAYPVGPYC